MNDEQDNDNDDGHTMPTKPDDPPLPSDAEEPTYLRSLHPMPWFDNHIHMDRVRHVYRLNGVDLSSSTTGYMKLYVGDFDADYNAKRILVRMRNHKITLGLGVARDQPEWLLKQYERYKHCMTVDDMKRAWDINRDAGTFVHRLIELYYNRMLVGECARHSALQSPEFMQFQRFHAHHIAAQGFEPYRTEFTMYLLQLGGQIDMLYRRSIDAQHPVRKYELWMVDWKRKFELGGHGEPLKPPFDNMPPGDRTKFTIQLNTYKRMIEANSPYRIVRMSILMVHPELLDYDLQEVPDIQPAIINMFERRRRWMIKRDCEKAIEHLRVAAKSEDRLKRLTEIEHAEKLLAYTRSLDCLTPNKQ